MYTQCLTDIATYILIGLVANSVKIPENFFFKVMVFTPLFIYTEAVIFF